MLGPLGVLVILAGQILCPILQDIQVAHTLARGQQIQSWRDEQSPGKWLFAHAGPCFYVKLCKTLVDLKNI